MVCVPEPAKIWNDPMAISTTSTPHSHGDCQNGRCPLPLPFCPLFPPLLLRLNGLPLNGLLLGRLLPGPCCGPWG